MIIRFFIEKKSKKKYLYLSEIIRFSIEEIEST